MTVSRTTASRVLQHVHHGGRVLPDDAPEAEKLAAERVRVSLVSEVLPGQSLDDDDVTTAFDYLFPGLADAFPDHHLTGDPAQVTAALTALGQALMEDPTGATDPAQRRADSTIPSIYTYWGQFIDHDVTASSDRNNAVSDLTVTPLQVVPPARVRRELRNLRQPSLNLDSLYGNGPFEDDDPSVAAPQYDGLELRLGQVAAAGDDGGQIPGSRVPMPADDFCDLPRQEARAQLGDGRNDENLIVAQFHVAMLRFHNAVLRWVRDHRQETYPEGDTGLFEHIRDLVRWHYQWLVVHDYLKTVCLPGVVDKVLLTGPRHFPHQPTEPVIPLEFSAAAYRFGHTMVRGAYDFNRNFGRHEGGPGQVLPIASFGLLFRFTGNSRPAFGGKSKVLPFNWVIEWDRFVDKGDDQPGHFARKIDTRIAPPLADMVNQITPEEDVLPAPVQAILKNLGVRNLLRGYQLALPTGQAVAEALGVRPLTDAELRQGNTPAVDAALTAGGFVQRTPLWFYVLKEAEVRANGNSLGEVGSRIVAETLIGELLADPDSYLTRGAGWNPSHGVLPPDGEPIVMIKDLLRFAGVLA
jgi:hypothetical protein